METMLRMIDAERAVERLMRFLAVEGVTGRERRIGAEVEKALREVGVPRSAIHYDTANERIPLPTETGNLIVRLPGTRPHAPRLLFSTHLDTVPLCAGAEPVRSKSRITAKGATALGGDNRTGVACLVTLAATLLERKLPHPPLTLLFTVREESGLYGARYLDPADLGGVVMGFNVDGRESAALTVGAVGAERWEVRIVGRAAHAGVHPEQGISSTLVASLALAEAAHGGWFGKIRRPPSPPSPRGWGRGGVGEGTANVGVFGGRDGRGAGDATNVVTDYVHIRGESRSHSPAFVKEIVAAWRAAFLNAAGRVKDDRGRMAKVRFTSQLDYHPFRLKDDAPVVRRAVRAAESLGRTPTLRVGNGGLDANWLVRHRIPTVTFGAGQNNIHTTEEYVDVKEFVEGCRMALALAAL